MTYPITPAPSVHNLPTAAQAQQNALTTEQLQAMGDQLVQSITNAILYFITGGIVGANAGSDSSQATNSLLSWFQQLNGQMQSGLMNLSQLAQSIGGQTTNDLSQWLQDLQTGWQTLTTGFNNLFQPGQSSIPQENIQPSTAVNATSVMFDAAGGGASTVSSSTISVNTSGLHTLGSTANYLVAATSYYTFANNTSGVISTCICGTQSGGPNESMVSLGRYQPSSGLGFFTELFVLAGPPTGAQTITLTVDSFAGVTLVGLETSSYIGVGAVGNPIISSPGTPATSLSQSVTGANSNEMVVQSFASFQGVSGSANTLSSYNQTQRGTTGSVGTSSDSMCLTLGDAVGASTVSFTATDSVNANYAGSALILAPTGSIIGSGFRAYRTLTGTAGSASNSQQVMPASWYNTVQYVSSDLNQVPYASSTNTLTVSHAGWYHVVINQQISNNAYSGYFVNALLYHNGLVVKAGPVNYINSGSTLNWNFGASWTIYCAAGDTLQPGWGTNATVSNLLTGEFTGTITYWEVMLANRSLL